MELTLSQGKTVLLDTIAYGASLTKRRKFEGTVSIHGVRSAASANRASKISYLTHKERLLTVFTVRETLMTASYLMKGMAGAEVVKQVDDLVEQLGLTDCADTVVGRLSGGQRRRCAIAVELINERRDILIMDEPTSGLDAHIALELIKCFIELVAKGRTFVFTMHQPTSEIAALLENVAVLTSKGSLAFQGSEQDGLDFFASLGFSAPKSWNPLDFFIEVVGDDFENRIGPNDVESIAVAFASSTCGLALAQARDGLKTAPVALTEEEPRSQVGFCLQFSVLMKRCAQMAWRNPGVLRVRTALYMLISLFLGLVFLGVGKSYDDSAILARNSVLFFVSGFYAFMSVVSLPQLIADRHVYISEKRNGLITPLPFVLSQSAATAFITFIISLAAAMFIVNMAALQNFGVYLGLLWISLFMADTFSSLVGTVAPNFLLGLVICAAYWATAMMTEGFFINLDDIPIYFQWISWITPMSYSFQSFMLNEYQANSTFDSQQFPNGWAVLDFFGYGPTGLFKWFTLYEDVAMILCGYTAAFLILFYAAVRFAW